MNTIQYRLADVRGRVVEPSNSGVSEAEPDNTRHERQQHALDEQLLDDAPSRRADRDTDGDLARAIGRARQKQVGHVRAGDEQHERDGAHERPEKNPYLVADDLLGERRHHCRDSLVGVGKLTGQGLGDAGHLAARLLDRHAVGEAAVGHQQTPGASGARLRRGPLRQRQPDVRVERKLHPRRHHADDRGRLRVHANRPADNRAISTVAALPDRVAQQHDRGSAGSIVFGRKFTSDRGVRADEREAVPGDVDAVILVGLALVGAEIHRAHLHQRYPGKRAGRATPILEIGLRDPKGATLRVTGVDHHDAIGIIERQGPQQHGIDEGEHGAGGADAEGERRHRGQRESAIPDEATGRELEILQNGCHWYTKLKVRISLLRSRARPGCMMHNLARADTIRCKCLHDI